ncbi:MAG: DUF5684 domain-containing protein [Eubacteriaceae bacterium]|jgi:hypothetical protein|nr:DUF5684 domain-containing protein [Eubacteriaceae bacterium]
MDGIFADQSGWYSAGHMICALAITVLYIIGRWKMFQKAGQHGWGAIVPFYNIYLDYKIAWGSGTAFFVTLILTVLAGFTRNFYDTNGSTMLSYVMLIVAAMAGIALIVIAIMLNVRMARAFGHGIGFAAGLIFLNVVFVIIIGFGSAKYKGPNGVPGDGPDRPLG